MSLREHFVTKSWVPCSQVVKVIWHKTASPPQMDGSIVFARWHQMCAPMWAHWHHLPPDCTCASFGPPESTTQTVNRSVLPFLAQLTAVCRRVPWRHLANTIEIVYIDATWQMQLNSYFLRPTPVHNPNGKSIDSAVTAHLTAESPYTLQWDAPFPPQNRPFQWGSEWVSSFLTAHQHIIGHSVP